MRKISKLLLGAFAVLFLTTSLFAALVPIKTVAFNFGPQKLEETEAIVQKVCAENNWQTVIYDKMNIIYATHDAGDWLMTVRIYFTTSRMEVTYNSTDLPYDQAKNLVDARYMDNMTALANKFKALLPAPKPAAKPAAKPAVKKK